MFIKLKVSYPPICENGELRVSIRRYCRIFLRSFDAHFFIALLPFWAILSRNFPPYFFAGIRACANMRFCPHTSVGNADRSRALWGFFLRPRVAQIFRGTMAFCTKICVRLRVPSLCFAVIIFFAETFKKTLDIS